MGMFGFMKKKQPDAVPSPPRAPDQSGKDAPSFDMPDIKFDFPQSGMDAPPLPSEIQSPPPLQNPLPDKMSWSFDEKPQGPSDKYPLPQSPPAKQFDELPPIKPLKFEDYSMGRQTSPEDDAPEQQLQEPMLTEPDAESEGVEPPGIGEELSAPAPKKRMPDEDAEPKFEEPTFDFDDSEFNFEEPQKAVMQPRTKAAQIAPPSRPLAAQMPIAPQRTVSRRLIDRDLYISVDDFREMSGFVNSLGDETKMAEEGLLRIKDVTLNKEKVYDKWQSDLEQVEKELIQLDKMLFKM
jgi:hypothetical protein